MRAIMVMFDSLNRRMLTPYGCNWVDTPNFTRLAQHAATFDNCWVGSMPCMPARRELHTGRYNFLHRSWGPLEPFDDSMPQLLKENGIHTHLVSDHYHYWEDGGATYHTKYSTWECVRGQEGDFWKGWVRPPEKPEVLGIWCEQDEVNRQYLKTEADFPQSQTFALGLDFIRQNAGEDNWFLQIETFDPHEPFVAAEIYREAMQDGYAGPRFDWPDYTMVHETNEQVRHARSEYAALVRQCDANLGRVLDAMDEHDLWRDTLLIVNTDHGSLLGEHECWAKSVHPYYNEVANTPLFVWHPGLPCQKQRRGALVQTIDIAPTLLEYFGLENPPDMLGRPLSGVLREDAPLRKAAIFGMHGGQLNITDGRFVYMIAPDTDVPHYEHTLMPSHMRGPFSVEELREAQLVAGFTFTKGCPVLKVPGENKHERPNPDVGRTMLFDLQSDPGQLHPYRDEVEENRLRALAKAILDENDAPPEAYARWGFDE